MDGKCDKLGIVITQDHCDNHLTCASCLADAITELRDENTRLQSSLTLSREEGRREGREEGATKMRIRAANAMRAYHNRIQGENTAAVIMALPLPDAAIRSEAKGERAGCTWTLQDDETGAWASTCGELWSFIDGGPQENRVRFCHGCGKPVKAQPVLETE